MNLKTCQRVWLISNQHGEGTDNPVRGSEFECKGEIIKVTNDTICPIKVQWDNGRANYYYASDLQIIPKERITI